MPTKSSERSAWQKSFDFRQVKCLIVCRGPIRKEAMEVFHQLGAKPSGILLSEKDSIVYPQTLAPELRMIADRSVSVHHVPDYTGASKEERVERIGHFIEICKKFHYTHLFAGYGFMAEDADFIRSIEQAGIVFVGPNSSVALRAGSKDEAKKLARSIQVSVTPGVDNITALTLLSKATGDKEKYLQEVLDKHALSVSAEYATANLEAKAELVLQASYAKQIDLISVQDLQLEAKRQAEQILRENPGKRIRFKYIGGGGGKGQRVIDHADKATDAAKEVLYESKATGAGDNKNFLIELNIEDTRHNEIQLLGNGEWCIALGGRDCSLQMHEQKLLEVSLTVELLEEAIASYTQKGMTQQAQIMQKDLEVLKTTCRQAEAFGSAVGLDSASTFECIIEADRHYFMEMNTRIQVEHRVTEMVYSLRFRNPDDNKDYFDLESLVAAMLYIACYGKKLPKPEKLPRYLSGVEARINATNAALKPHAGGIIRSWSEPSADEIRDDQGIGIPNPDTGRFQPYNIAGAYDSNVALTITHGKDRLDTYLRLANILRCTEVRGTNVQLNSDFHYGLLHWLIGNDAMVKPNTRFVQSYLAAVGALCLLSRDINLEIAWENLTKHYAKNLGQVAQAVFEKKLTLLTRPLKQLLDNPHLLAGWLAPKPRRRWDFKGESFKWLVNPLEVLKDLYFYLRLEERPNVPAVEKIWPDDNDLLESGLRFYEQLRQKLGNPQMPWAELLQQLQAAKSPSRKISKELWEEVLEAHNGFQLGLELLQLPVAMGRDSKFFAMRGNDQLTVDMPSEFTDAQQIKKLTTELAPPPVAKSNEIVSWTGGTFFAKESPTANPFVVVGQHFEKGDVLGILEVMKMFNPIHAEFAGTIRKVRTDGSVGIVVSRGQVLFEVEPDVQPTHETDQQRLDRQKKRTLELLKW